MKGSTDNKEFWKRSKPFLSDKVTAPTNIILVENGKLLSNERKIAKNFTTFLNMLLTN